MFFKTVLFKDLFFETAIAKSDFFPAYVSHGSSEMSEQGFAEMVKNIFPIVH